MPETTTAPDQLAQLYTVSQFCEKHPSFKVGGIRHLIFFEASNGLAQSGAIIRQGRKVLIHSARFFNWLDSQQKRAA
ncbi:MAG: hypothetical protein EPN21_14270 [Methylococcaceae bacterium]|nr:MAG: hypothetical protein EPN21_14270 [Methylococcaceae bacterium]